jgi:hypothetical protein
MTSKIQGEYVGKKYRFNESTIFINGETGADCQKVHIDNALLCTCFTKWGSSIKKNIGKEYYIF